MVTIMSRTTITRKIEWDAGHRVLGHEGRCKHLHGHRYVAEVTVSAPDLDSCGRVIDFSVLKERVGKWVDDNWDHNFLLHPDDPMAGLWAADRQTLAGITALRVFADREPYIFPQGTNPTAENIARVLFQKAVELLKGTGIYMDSVRVYETPNCHADYSEHYNFKDL